MEKALDPRPKLSVEQANRPAKMAHVSKSKTSPWPFSASIPVQKVLPTTAGTLMSMEVDCGHGALTYGVRLMTFLPGKSIYDSQVTPLDFYQVGKFIASLNFTTEKALDPRPKLSLEQANRLVQRLYGIVPCQMSSLPSYVDQNFLVVSREGSKFVLKIVNAEESKNYAHLEIQNLITLFVGERGIPVQKVLPTTAGTLMSMEEMDCGHGALTYCVRLMTFLPGKSVYDSQVTLQDLYQVGKFIASLNEILQQLDLPNSDALDFTNNPWNMLNIAKVQDFLTVVDEGHLQEVILGVVKAFQLNVLPQTGSFRKGIIHNDLNDRNILVTPALDGHHNISGVLDFSLLGKSCIVFEVAISIMYHMFSYPTPLDVGGAILAGWQSVMVLNEEEKDSLYLLVLGRLCQSLVYGLDNARKYPDNAVYLQRTSQIGVRILKLLWELGKEEVLKKWFSDHAKFS
ncbi:hydroxylysine kinase-like [Neosynchiropus ocellatus]